MILPLSHPRYGNHSVSFPFRISVAILHWPFFPWLFPSLRWWVDGRCEDWKFEDGSCDGWIGCLEKTTSSSGGHDLEEHVLHHPLQARLPPCLDSHPHPGQASLGEEQSLDQHQAPHCQLPIKELLEALKKKK